jgi:hypothetical protein
LPQKTPASDFWPDAPIPARIRIHHPFAPKLLNKSVREIFQQLESPALPSSPGKNPESTSHVPGSDIFRKFFKTFSSLHRMKENPAKLTHLQLSIFVGHSFLTLKAVNNSGKTAIFTATYY